MNKVSKIKIGELCTLAKGKIGIKKAIPGIYPLVVTAENRASHNEWHFNKPSVIIPLVSSTGHGHASLKRIHYQEGEFAVGNILCVVTPKDENILNANFLYHYLDVYKEELLVSRMKGMANVTLPMKEIAQVEIPLISIQEQNKWVELFESVSSNTGQLSSEISNQKELLKKLRQQILQDAIQGKLTKKWREAHGDIEPASILLKKIKAEKERLIVEKKIKKQKQLSPISQEEIPFDIPENWEWCRLDYLCSITGGKRVPAGYKLRKSKTPHIYIRVTDMKNGTIDDNDLHYIDEWVYSKIKQYIITKNDIYMTIVGATIGKCGLVPEKFHNMNLTENAARISPIILDRLFLNLVLGSPFLQAQCIDKTKKVGVEKMALIRFRSSLVTLPPLKEQKAIVTKVEKLFKYCDELEKQIENSEKSTENLMQSVLKEAFE